MTGAYPSTLFTLRTREGTAVAKALCAYENEELGRAGPTIELLEVARPWRRAGLGSALLGAVEHFFEELLEVGC